VVEIDYADVAGHIVHVSSVARGLACGATCLGCGAVLLSRQGVRLAWHFSHVVDTECDGAPETALHRRAKSIVAGAARILLPELGYTDKLRYHYHAVIEALAFVPESAELEVRLPSGRVVDVMLARRGRALAVEIMVTHAVDNTKISALRRDGIAALEIDLSGVERQIGDAPLAAILLDSVDRKKWLLNPLYERRVERIEAFIAECRRADDARVLDREQRRQEQQRQLLELESVENARRTARESSILAWKNTAFEELAWRLCGPEWDNVVLLLQRGLTRWEAQWVVDFRRQKVWVMATWPASEQRTAQLESSYSYPTCVLRKFPGLDENLHRAIRNARRSSGLHEHVDDLSDRALFVPEKRPRACPDVILDALAEAERRDHSHKAP
jgi:hypothetical protein